MSENRNEQLDPGAMELPAPFVNRFQVLVAGDNVRISFAEGFAGQVSNYRSAIVMSSSDARALAQAIISSFPSSGLAAGYQAAVAAGLGLGTPTLLGGAPSKNALRDAVRLGKKDT